MPESSNEACELVRERQFKMRRQQQQMKQQHKLRRVTSAHMANSMASNSDEYAVGCEFELGLDALKKFKHEEARWERKVQGWFPPDEQFNRDYLGEIRSMVMKKV
ncbi:hypothetical protein D0Z03_003049 [Geotrichum reessii]|nr:hypothetical protein D0Z03_003049 [Galactomyces reessii]